MSAWLKVACAALLIAAISWAVLEIRADGARSVLHTIERQNNEAANRAQEKRIAYDSCIDSGGLWDFRTQKCHGP